MAGSEQGCFPGQTETQEEMCRQWNYRHVSLDRYRDTVWGYSLRMFEGSRKSRHKKRYLARDVNYKNIFYIGVTQKRNTNYIVLSLINGMGYPVTLTWRRQRYSSISLPQFSLSAKSLSLNSVAEEWSRASGLRLLQEPGHIQVSGRDHSEVYFWILRDLANIVC